MRHRSYNNGQLIHDAMLTYPKYPNGATGISTHVKTYLSSGEEYTLVMEPRERDKYGNPVVGYVYKNNSTAPANIFFVQYVYE